MTNAEGGGAERALRALAGALGTADYITRLTAGRTLALTIACRHDPSRHEAVYAGHSHYFWRRPERLAPLADVDTAVTTIAKVLGGVRD